MLMIAVATMPNTKNLNGTIDGMPNRLAIFVFPLYPLMRFRDFETLTVGWLFVLYIHVWRLQINFAPELGIVEN